MLLRPELRFTGIHVASELLALNAGSSDSPSEALQSKQGFFGRVDEAIPS